MSIQKGKRAYELRDQYRWNWQKIADEVGCPTAESAISGAKKYSEKNQLEWPLRKVPQPVLKRQRRIQRDLEIYEAVASGTQIRSLGTPSAVYRAMDRHAKANNLPILARNDERAYKLRVAGKKWTEIGVELGYQYSNHAVEAARKFAYAKDLDWPIKR